jgi:calcium-dependent protein kinase
METVVNDFLIKKSTFIVKNQDPLEKHYKVTKKTLGSGSYGVVSQAQHLHTKQMRAVKTIPKKKIKNPERFEAEVKILQELDHPNAIKLYEYFEDAKNVHLICEMCTGGELFDHIIA